MIVKNLRNLPQKAVSHNPEIKKKVMLSMGDLPHLTNFSQASFAPGQIAAAHSHQDMSEIFFVTAGEGIIKIGDRIYSLTPDICIAVEVDEVHEITNTGSKELVITYFGIKN